MNFKIVAAVLTALSLPALAGDVAGAAAAANGATCAVLMPFYWEVGDAQQVLASGSVGAGPGRHSRDTMVSIASASKWVYGAYVNETKRGRLTVSDIDYLNMESGWSRFDQCDQTDTVSACAARVSYSRRSDGKFDYSGGHFQKHAAANGLGSLTSAALAQTINATLGTTFTYTSAQLAGGVRTSAGAFAVMLQKIMRKTLVDGSYLASDMVSTQGTQVIFSPVPEPWHYGRGHWIETDGTFSSPGAFGFYPWISANQTLYGIVAAASPAAAWDSVQCGRAIRAAFLK